MFFLLFGEIVYGICDGVIFGMIRFMLGLVGVGKGLIVGVRCGKIGVIGCLFFGIGIKLLFSF